MPVLFLDCHLPHNTPHIPSRYNNEQTTKQTKAINNSYIYISHVNVTQTVPDISPLMPMHQDPLLVVYLIRAWWRKYAPHCYPLCLGLYHQWQVIVNRTQRCKLLWSFKSTYTFFRETPANHQQLDCLFTFVQQRKNKAPHYRPFVWRGSTGYRWIPPQRASDT